MNDVIVKETYDNLLRQLKERYGFEASGWDENRRGIRFTRKIDNGFRIHEVNLRDDRNDKIIGDWLIYSYAFDDFGGWDDYALELGEYKLFAMIIECLEKLYPLTVMKKKGEK